MTISVDMLFQILGLLGTVIGVIWYMSSLINDMKKEIAKSNQLNEIQDKNIEQIELNIEKKILEISQKLNENYGQCRDGRVKIWEDLNASKIKIASIEASKKD
jgi:1-aminocyclopropane-1-carboxylate deaminase/D-cysteine desulfhydrase-like pyridoxal-dependent ACC family enzyme